MFLFLKWNTNPKFCTLYLQNNFQEKITLLWLPDTVTSVFPTCDHRLRLPGPFRPLLRRISVGSQRLFPWDKALWRDGIWEWLEALARLVCLISLERQSLFAWLKRGGNDCIRKQSGCFQKGEYSSGSPTFSVYMPMAMKVGRTGERIKLKTVRAQRYSKLCTGALGSCFSQRLRVLKDT